MAADLRLQIPFNNTAWLIITKNTLSIELVIHNEVKHFGRAMQLNCLLIVQARVFGEATALVFIILSLSPCN